LTADRWIIPGLVGLAVGALATLGMWRLFRHRHRPVHQTAIDQVALPEQFLFLVTAWFRWRLSPPARGSLGLAVQASGVSADLPEGGASAAGGHQPEARC
jgi:hypothetical protein